LLRRGVLAPARARGAMAAAVARARARVPAARGARRDPRRPLRRRPVRRAVRAARGDRAASTGASPRGIAARLGLRLGLGSGEPAGHGADRRPGATDTGRAGALSRRPALRDAYGRPDRMAAGAPVRRARGRRRNAVCYGFPFAIRPRRRTMRVLASPLAAAAAAAALASLLSAAAMPAWAQARSDAEIRKQYLADREACERR